MPESCGRSGPHIAPSQWLIEAVEHNDLIPFTYRTKVPTVPAGVGERRQPRHACDTDRYSHGRDFFRPGPRQRIEPDRRSRVAR